MRSRASIITLLIAAVMIRALVPSGFMFERGDTGGIVLELCGGHGGFLVFDPNTGETSKYDPGAPREQQDPKSSCGFTLASIGVASLEPPVPTSPMGRADSLLVPPLVQTSHPRPTLTPTPPRGPPSA
ncbi:MAG: DUF2946 family protein [Parvularcula sp.]